MNPTEYPAFPRDALRYVLYARKSSESEDRQVQSIDDQLHVLRRFAAQRGLTVTAELAESKSAKAEGARPVFARMLQMFRDGEADAVLCWAVNRLARNPEDGGRLAGLLQRGQIRAIQTPDRRYLPDDNALILAVDTGVANQFILDLRKNTVRGMAAKVERGWFPHKAPAGYLNDTHRRQGERTISADPERFPLIRRAFEMLLTGRHSVEGVRAALNDEWGFRTRPSGRAPGRPLPRNTFYNMVGNIFYAGYFVEDGVIHRGAHEAMLTLEEFRRLQALVRGRRPNARTRHALAYRGLIRCAHCGGWVTAERHARPSGRTYRYYRCGGGAGRLPCRRHRIREDALEAAMAGELARVTIDDEVAALLVAANEEWRARAVSEQLGEYEAVQRALTEANRRLAAVLDMKLEGLLTAAEYAAKKGELLAGRASLEARLVRAGAVSEEVRETVLGTVEFHRQARALFADGDAALRRAVALMLGASYTLERGRLRMELSPILRPVSDSARALRDGAPDGDGTPDGDGDGMPDRAGAAYIPRVAQPVLPGREAGRAGTSRTPGTGSGSTKKGTRAPAVRFGVPDGARLELAVSVVGRIAAVAEETGIHMPNFR